MQNMRGLGYGCRVLTQRRSFAFPTGVNGTTVHMMMDPPQAASGKSGGVVSGAYDSGLEDDGDEGGLVIATGRDILVVDDNDTNLIAIEAALQPLGRKMVLARSGVEALARLLEQDFALIILDVAMPGMDGFETARLVRSRARNRATPI